MLQEARSEILLQELAQDVRLLSVVIRNQIDAHNLDKLNNGLVFASEKMKGSPLCAQVTFNENESVRSELAKEAIKRLAL